MTKKLKFKLICRAVVKKVYFCGFAGDNKGAMKAATGEKLAMKAPTRGEIGQGGANKGNEGPTKGR